MSDHDQFEALAVRLVLGGLDPVDAAAFRSHLQSCNQCRSRVVELRGIAANLAEVEQDERAGHSLRTELPPRTERVEDEPLSATRDPQGVNPRHVMVAALVVLVLAAATAFWNFHLRTVVATAALAAEDREETLAGLAEGVPVHAELGAALQGLVVVGDERLAFVLSGVSGLENGERLVARISGGSLTRPQIVRVAQAGQLAGGTFSANAAFGDARRLTVVREGPAGSTLLLEAEIAEPRPLRASEREG